VADPAEINRGIWKFQVTSRRQDDSDGEEAGEIIARSFLRMSTLSLSLKAFAMICSVYQLLYGNTILINL